MGEAGGRVCVWEWQFGGGGCGLCVSGGEWRGEWWWGGRGEGGVRRRGVEWGDVSRGWGLGVGGGGGEQVSRGGKGFGGGDVGDSSGVVAVVLAAAGVAVEGDGDVGREVGGGHDGVATAKAVVVRWLWCCGDGGCGAAGDAAERGGVWRGGGGEGAWVGGSNRSATDL
ncbi:hypothetical protein Tco_0046356 [Tanacetum coccineum]